MCNHFVWKVERSRAYAAAKGLPGYDVSGAYVREDKPLEFDYDHPGTPNRLAALREVAKEIDATLNQVVLAWMIGGDVPVIPFVGASSVAQLNESLEAVDIALTEEQRAKLDDAS